MTGSSDSISSSVYGLPNPLSLGGTAEVGEMDDWTISPDDSPSKSDGAKGFASPRSAAGGGGDATDFASVMKASTAATVARLVDIATEREGSSRCEISKSKGDDELWDKNDDSDETLPASPETLFPGLSISEDGLAAVRAVRFGDSSISRLPGKRTQ